MSSVAKSGLLRPRNSSAIPVPTRLSRLSVRNSAQKSRAKSLSHTTQDKLSLDRNMTRSSSHSNLSDVPRFSRQRSGSLVRQTLNTPLNQMGNRACRKSPLLSSVRKDNRPINDKRWQYEQTVKVRKFVASEFPHLDHNGIKAGIPLELFIAVTDCYFKLIDRRLSVTRDNYIEEVPNKLKLYRYPAAGSVKPSLMKTVNTPHSWPHVIAILSWLTDIIYEINRPEDDCCDLKSIAEKCFFNMYEQWNKCQDDTENMDFTLSELDVKMATLFNYNEEEDVKLDEELEKLRVEKAAYAQKKQEIMKKLEASQNYVKSVNEKCDRYITESEQFEKKLNDQLANYRMKIKKKDQELSALHEEQNRLEAIIASQPYSYAEKLQLTEEIQELQNTLKLKNERRQQQLELINTYDFKLVDIKQKVEASAYQYNNVISKLELINPEFKVLHIREKGFARMDTEDEIKEVQRALRDAINKLKQELETCGKRVEELAKKQKQVDEACSVAQAEVDELSKLDAELNITLTQQTKKHKLEREQILAKINKYRQELGELKNSRFDLASLREEVKRLENKKEEFLKFKEDLVKRALEFFSDLETRMANNLQTYMNVMEEITTAMISTQERAIEDSKSRIEQLKKAREEAEGK